MKLHEGHETVGSAGATAGFSAAVGCVNVGVPGAVIGTAFRSVIRVEGEDLILFEPVRSAALLRKNVSRGVADAEEEAHILGHPDVVAAVDAALPELEAWERTL
jgi:hypothetical protein